MNRRLDELRQQLTEAQTLSRQASYERGAPDKKAMPTLLKARLGLRALLEEQPQVADGWRLLSLAEECLLNYPAAEQALNKALELSPNRDKRDLKRLALLREYTAKWKALALTPNDL